MSLRLNLRRNPFFLRVTLPQGECVSTLADIFWKQLPPSYQRKSDLPTQPSNDRLSRALKWLQGRESLDAAMDLSAVFPDEPSSDAINIIVSDPEVLEMSEGLDDPLFSFHKKLRKNLGACFDSLRPPYLPSDIVASESRIGKLFEGTKTHIHHGRPGGAPAAIFSPAIATLQHRLDHLDQVEVNDREVGRATEYLNGAIRFYKDEELREMAIKDIVDAAVGAPSSSGRTLLLLKNIVGLSGNPILQAILDYSKIISQEKYKRFREFCNFPTVLIGIAETRIDISIAVYVGEIHVTKLLTLDVTSGFLASDNIVHLARVFKALSCRLRDLALYYDEIGQETVPRFSCLFPNPTSVDPSVNLSVLSYKRPLSRTGQPASTLLDLGNTTTAMYIATLNGADKEVVKFTSRYNEKAHRILASAGLAPELHFCGRVVGGPYMVVMDLVDGKSLWELQGSSTPIPLVVLEDVRKAVKFLHEQNIVLGDWRDGNILYDASKGGAVVVDLDWAGVDGVDRYSATLNSFIEEWHDDVVPYGIMRKDHDLWQLRRLEGLLRHRA